MANQEFMNFLSHFYFDRNTENHNQVLGIVLPDLLKNANKTWTIHPEKNEEEYTGLNLISLYTGWKRHILVDKYFHCSIFFLEHSRTIRTEIFPFLVNSPVKPFFVAHIALELMLDSLLLKENLITASRFYWHLEQINKTALSNFLEINKIDDPERFIRFLNKFIASGYLESYRDANQIVNAINGICTRLWIKPFDEEQKIRLTKVIVNYMIDLRKEFMIIFDEIEKKLS